MNLRSAVFGAAFLLVGLVAGVVIGGHISSSPSTQFVAKGQTWNYFAFYSPSLGPPPSSMAPGDSFAVINSDSSWTSAGKAFPELFQSPGQTRTYKVRLFINSDVLPMTGQVQAMDGLGLGVHFNGSSISGSDGGGALTMTVSLAANFSSGVNIIYIPVVFSSADRIQPVSFGPVYLVSGFPGQNATGTTESAQPAISFQDDIGRGYGVDLAYVMNNTSVLSDYFGPNSDSVCAGIISDGQVIMTHDPVGFPCDSMEPRSISVALKSGHSTTLTLSLRLATQTGVGLGFSIQEYGNSESPFFSIDFNPKAVVLQPGLEVNVTVTLNALQPGSDTSRIVISAMTLEGSTVGIGDVYSAGINVFVVGQ